MKILVANLGSTSFKYRLFDMADGEKVLAKGSVESIGTEKAKSVATTDRGSRVVVGNVPDHAVAVEACLKLLTDKEMGVLQSAQELAGIGFKAVHPGKLDPDGPLLVTANLLDEMAAFNDVAPAHNPVYVKAMRMIAEQLPSIPQVAAFETVFHRSIPEARRLYAIPYSFSREWGIKRYGFHGASHRFIAERSAQVLKNPKAKVISCHLGGSSSLCAIDSGMSVATTMGISPQSGLPQNNRVGDLDIFALPLIQQRTGKTQAEVLKLLGSEGGLLGISNNFSNSARDLRSAADAGNTDAQRALDCYVEAIRHYLGAFLVHLGGADAIVFTGGIGENASSIRAAICSNLNWCGISLDARRNLTASGEMAIHEDRSATQIWILPTNEEIIVARQTVECLRKGRN